VQHQLDVRGTGTTVKGIKQSELRKVMLRFPTLSKQKIIAHILGSLDDKIELNRQINQTLESIVQALFKSWFVDFDPVIDNALTVGNRIPDVFTERAKQRKQLKSEKGTLKPSKNPHQSHFPSEFEYSEKMGWIPKGWHNEKLNELLEIKYGKAHKKLEEGTIPVYGSGGLMRWVNKSLYIGESILIPRKGTLSNLMFVDEEFWTVDTMFFSIPKLKNSAKYLFYQLKMLDLSSMNVGSAVPSMTTKVLNDLNILRPEHSVLQEFDRFTTDFFKKQKALDKETESLSKLRDTLLPKLLSGELHIPDAEKLLENI
jgi:type I restriction enzyme S subunit